VRRTKRVRLLETKDLFDSSLLLLQLFSDFLICFAPSRHETHKIRFMKRRQRHCLGFGRDVFGRERTIECWRWGVTSVHC
jgi:hypothetical protein